MLNYEFPIDDTSKHIVYDYSLIKQAFDYISIESSIDFDFQLGGCQQRSHLMSLILTRKFNIEHSKIWLFSPASLFDFDTRTLFIEDVNHISFDNQVQWNYHTAPVVKVKNGNFTELYIIDPSISRKDPLNLNQWLQAIGNSQISKYTFLMPEKYFFNCKYNDSSQLTNVFAGSFFEYENPAKDNLAVEKGLAVNDMAMSIHHKYIKPLMNDGNANPQTIQDLKDVFGNATALDLLFGQNLSGNTENTSFRYVLTHYGDIIKEGKHIFNERLLFWTRFTNELLETSKKDASVAI